MTQEWNDFIIALVVTALTDEHDDIACETCNGTGTLECACGGYSSDCMVCGGWGVFMCDDCNGTGLE